MEQVPNEQGGFEPPSTTKISPAVLIGGGVVIGGLIIALGFFIFSLLTGSGDVAKTVPVDAAFYMGADMTKVMDTDAQELFEVFRDAMDDDEVIDDFKEEFEDELGVTFEDDIAPWIGASTGFAIYDMKFDDYGSMEDAKAVFVFSVRDTDAADEFIEDILDHQEDENDMDFDDSEYEGATIFMSEDEEFAIARYKKYLYIGNGEDPIEDAIDAAMGESLADLKEYKDLIKELPNARLLTLYVGSDAMQDFMDAMMTSMYMDLPSGGDFELNETTMGASLMITDEGIQIDAVSLFEESELPDAQIEMLKAQNAKKETPSMFPEDTFLFIASQRLDLGIQMMEETNEDAYDDFSESMELFDDEFGIDMMELILLLDGEFSFGLFPESSGYIAEMSEMPIGWQVVASTSEEGEFADAFEDLAEIAEEDLYMLVDDDSFGEVDFYTLADEYSEGDMMSFGSGESFIFLTSDIDIIEDGYEQKDSLADSDVYKATWKAFSRSTIPVFYLDLQELLDVIKEASYDQESFKEDTAFFDPITIIAAGAEKYSKGKTHSVTIIFVDK